MTVGEIAAHGHTMRYKASNGSLTWGYIYEYSNANNSSPTEASGGIGITGGSQKHNNTQAFFVTYSFKRIG